MHPVQYFHKSIRLGCICRGLQHGGGDFGLSHSPDPNSGNPGRACPFMALEWIGAVLFAALGAAYLVMAWGKVHWAAFVFISGPLALIGILFLLNWIHRAELRKKS